MYAGCKQRGWMGRACFGLLPWVIILQNMRTSPHGLENTISELGIQGTATKLYL